MAILESRKFICVEIENANHNKFWNITLCQLPTN